MLIPKVPDAVIAEMRALRAQGMTYRQLGARFGITESAARWRISHSRQYRDPGEAQCYREISPRPSRWGLDWAERHRQWLERTILPLVLLALLVPAMAAAQATVEIGRLCHNGHPVRRAEHVTYGGLPERHGYQRDHVVPLGLGGPNDASNVRYQRCDLAGKFRCLVGPAADKDDDEHTAEERMCGKAQWSPSYARQWLAERWPIDRAHGYGLMGPQ